jgi:pilus assembly protein CpaC
VKQEGKRDMANGMLSRTARSAASIAVAIVGSIALAHAGGTRAEPRPAPAIAAAPAAASTSVQVAASEAGSHFIPLGIGKSVVIDLPRDVKDVLVADPKIANAVIRSSRRAYMIGVTVGQTSVFFFDSDGRQIAGFDIAVTRDLNGVRAALRQMFPDADIRIEGVGDGIVLSGTAANQAEAQQAYDIAARLAGDTKVVNGIVVRDRDQVMIKVTVAEMQRDVAKQLGVNLDGSIGNGATTLKFSTRNPYTASGGALSDTNFVGKFPNVTATLQAMERAGVVRTLAEPNLTAISGESATFLAGGEFPYPIPGTCSTCPASVDFKKFGVGLTFTPVVLSEGRISLKVMTEVSELSTEGALTIGSTSVSALKVRRADTTLEIPSSGALVMGGMIKEQTKQAINGIPGLLELPVLGTLFRSRDFVSNQTELVIIATPYVVRPVARKDLSRPDDGFADASDPAANLMGRINRIYGTAGASDARPAYRGKYGFILD